MIKVIKMNFENMEEVKMAFREKDQMDLEAVKDSVDEIIKAVREKGDNAVIDFTEKYDNVKMKADSIEVSEDEILNAYDNVSDNLLSVMEQAAENIEKFHEKQLEKSWFDANGNGTILGRKITPLETVGVYVPGGTAPLPSSVLMNIIPARVAGVENIYMCTPPGKDGKVNPLLLAAAGIAGVGRVFAVGGAQAVASLAFGTETIPKVDKIVGPGNIYVSMAKKQVFGYCDIDMFAGPSDILIIADDNADNEFIAADFLSQAEHDILAGSTAIVFNEEKAKKLSIEIERQLEKLGRREIAEKAVSENGSILVAENMEAAVEISNYIAPEHLELMVKEPFELLGKIRNAGAIFLGYYASEPIGDYFAGPNHVLPTNGSARFSSPLGTEQFMKKSSIIYYDRSAFEACAEQVIDFAEAEGLDAHANAVRIRKEKGKD